jgi:hypothetical protein
MRSFGVGALVLALAVVAEAQQIDYGAPWNAGRPFDQFLSSVRAREAQWKSRFANAAVDADALTRVRALKEKRRILAVAEDRCSDSAWAVPYIAKLAAAVPERLELRVIGRLEGGAVQSANLTPDGRAATPTIVILDESGRALGAWVERPSELQEWVIQNKPSISSDELHARMHKWYTEDAGKSTVREIVALLEKSAGGK